MAMSLLARARREGAPRRALTRVTPVPGRVHVLEEEGMGLMLRRVSIALVAVTVVVLVGCLGMAGVALAAGDANEAFCPQETEASPGFRSYLPDCRAYELVTPQFKNGSAFGEGTVTKALVSVDGSRVIAQNLGVLAETGGDAFFGDLSGAVYEMTRGSEGWSVSSLQPPQPRFLYNSDEYAKPGFEGADVGLERTAWIAREAGRSVNGLFVREPGGQFVEVGPVERGVANLVSVAGADEGLNTFLLQPESNVPGSLWPGDPTVSGERSLYEYTGVHQVEPAMVAVKNEGVLSHNADAVPITACGSELGAGTGGSDYDAVSDSGDAVFFTAFEETTGRTGSCEEKLSEADLPVTGWPKVNELYVRVDGEKTLDLSEPPLSGAGSIPGRECGSTCTAAEENSPSAAVYQGASEDGTRVFFTTGQPLDKAAEEDVSGGAYLYEETIVKEGLSSRVTSLTLLGSGVEGVVRVSADGSRVYFVSSKVLADNENSEAVTASEGAGKDDLYVYDTAQGGVQPRLVYIATLSEADERDWAARDFRRAAQASLPDGRFLVFASVEPVTKPDPSSEDHGLSQLFEYDAESGQFGRLERVSIGQSGSYDGDGEITSSTEAPTVPGQDFVSTDAGLAESQALSRSQDLAVTEAGDVFFASEAKLTPLALRGFNNVYEYEDGGVYLISDGQDTTLRNGNGASVVQVMSTTSSGDDVFFQTADSLVPQDGDTELDYYDARIGGGFPAPAVQAPCGESCQGASPLAPSLSSPASAGYGGGVNLPPPPPAQVAAKPKVKTLTRSQKLAKALKACREDKRKGKRAACEAKARKSLAKAKKSTNGKGSK